MELYKHQQELIKQSPNRICLFWECGSGKTYAILELVKLKSENCLIICPKSIKQQWQEQTNHLVMTKEEFRRDWNKLPKYDCIVIDEAHNFTGYKSQLHKNTYKYFVKHQPKFIYGLTATPYLSSMWNLYALERLLGKNPNWYEYNKKYFNKVKMGNRTISVQKPNLGKEVARICNNIGSTVKLSDCVDVPEQIFQTEYFNLTPEQKRAILEVKKSEFLPIVKYSKILQIENGTLKSDGYSKNQFYKSEKLSRLLEIIKEHKKIAIFFKHKLEIELVKKNIKNRKVFVISGDVENRDEVVKQIEKEDDAIALIMIQCSAGYELPTINFIVYYSLSFSFVDLKQSQGRFLRINRPTKNVYLYLLNDKDSIDFAVYDNVVNKKSNFYLEIYAKTHKNL